jgi:hypothetical protein
MYFNSSVLKNKDNIDKISYWPSIGFIFDV